MLPLNPQNRRRFTESARAAALAARKARMEQANGFGLPELFVVKAAGPTFTWELRRFGGIVLERGPESFTSAMLARADDEKALVALCAAPDLPKFKRQSQPPTNSVTARAKEAARPRGERPK